MNDKTVNGGWYSDLTLDGDYGSIIGNGGVLINSEVIPPAHDERIYFANPNSSGNDLLFFRLHRWSNLFFAGKGHIGGECWLRNTLEPNYRNLGPTHGNSPLCFWNGFLYIVRTGVLCEVYSLVTNTITAHFDEQIGTQGIRYINDNGIPIWGDPTYSGCSAEYTVCADKVIGQGYLGGVNISNVDCSNGKLLEQGDTTFIRSYYSNGKMGSAIVKPGYGKFWWYDYSEIPSLPDYPKEPPEPPVIEPPPVVSEPMILPDLAYKDVVDLYNANKMLANGTDDQRRQLTAMIVQQITFDYPSESYGHKAEKGGSVSKDTLGKVQAGKLIAWDLFNGTTRAPNPAPLQSFDLNSATQEVRFYQGVDFLNHSGTGGGGSNPPPVDNNMQQQIDELTKQVAALTDKVNQLEQTSFHDGSPVALQTSSGNYITAELGGGKKADDKPLATNRTDAGLWETYKLIKK